MRKENHDERRAVNVNIAFRRKNLPHNKKIFSKITFETLLSIASGLTMFTIFFAVIGTSHQLFNSIQHLIKSWSHDQHVCEDILPLSSGILEPAYRFLHLLIPQIGPPMLQSRHCLLKFHLRCPLQEISG